MFSIPGTSRNHPPFIMQQFPVVYLCLCGCLTGVHDRNRASVGTGQFPVGGQDRLSAHPHLTGAVPCAGRCRNTGLGCQHSQCRCRSGCHSGICHGGAHPTGSHIGHRCSICDAGYRLSSHTDAHLVRGIDLSGAKPAGAEAGGARHHNHWDGSSSSPGAGSSVVSRKSST